MIENSQPQAVSMRATLGFMGVGLVPILMLLAFWMRSGTGLGLPLIGAMFFLLGAFLVSLNYYMFYRQHLPRSALVPPAWWKGLLVAALLLPCGAYNMLATSAGIGLTLSPGPRIESGQLVSTMVKVVTMGVSPGLVSPLKLTRGQKLDLTKQKWLLNRPFMNGALWGAVGYALAFGISGLLFGLMRQEILDPRDEHLGSGVVAALTRGAVGLYYGSAVGFAMGAVLIWVLRTLFPTLAQTTPASLLHWVFVLGAASNPNVAFSYAFSTACLMAGAAALFSGRPDFTAAISDPKAPELTRPVEVHVPEVPEAPEVPFDMGRVAAESQQLIGRFNGELDRMFTGPEWNYEKYDLPPVGRAAGRGPEPAATNLISARDTFDDDDMNAMGSLSNVYVQIVVDLGKLEIPVSDWLCLREGAILDLPRSSDNTINVSINGKPAGRGRALTVNGNKAVKMVQMSAEVERLAQQAAGG